MELPLDRFMWRHIFVNGIEISAIWSLDVEAGWVKTYDIFGKNDTEALPFFITELDRSQIPADWEIETQYVFASRTLRGRVVIEPPLTEPNPAPWHDRTS
jgi:hypothetical protein